MRVSVVIPTYNRCARVTTAVQSVLAQGTQLHEVLVIDDGSTDDTPAAMAAIQDRRLRYVWKDNAGVSAARNLGLDLATGDWIAFLDSDDHWLPSRLAVAAKAVESNPAIEFMQCNRSMFDDSGHVLPGLSASAEQMRDPIGLLSTFKIKTSAVMIKRDLIQRLHLRFPVDQETCEDYHLFWRALLCCRAVGFTEESTAMIHVSSDSLSRAVSPACLQKDNIHTLVEVLVWADRRGVDRRYVEALASLLHWQLRDYFVMLMHSGSLSTLLRYVAIAWRHEGVVRGSRGVLSAMVGCLSTPPLLAHER